MFAISEVKPVGACLHKRPPGTRVAIWHLFDESEPVELMGGGTPDLTVYVHWSCHSGNDVTGGNMGSIRQGDILQCEAWQVSHAQTFESKNLFDKAIEVVKLRHGVLRPAVLFNH